MTGATPPSQVPVTILTGYLGAGKTSVLNHVLHKSLGKRYAVIVNELGDIGVDGDLIDSGDEELIELSSGCICCVMRGDLIRTVRDLLARQPGLDGILIETTGVAIPAPVIQTFFADQILAAQCRLDGVVTVVDAIHIGAQLLSGSEAAEQIALASLILLNKAGEAPDIAGTTEQLRALNQFAPIHRIDRGHVDPDRVLSHNGFDLSQIQTRLDQTDVGHTHLAKSGISTLALTTDVPIDAERLHVWLQNTLAVCGEDILRTKGVIWANGSGKRLVIQAVHMLLEGGFTSTWEAAAPHTSKLVFIGRNLDAENLRQGFLACQISETA